MKKWMSAAAFGVRELATDISPDVTGCTVKVSIESGLTGSAFRLVFAEDYGKTPAEYNGAVAEVAGQKAQITFDGAKAFVVHPGQRVVSDPVELPVKAGELITLWIAVGEHGSHTETAVEQLHTAKGDYTWEGFEAQPFKNPLPGVPFNERLCGLKELQVEVPEESEAGVIAVFGDSITESGVWVRPLQQRIREQTEQVTLLNLGVGGNRLLKDTDSSMMMGVNAFGKAGLKRFDSDVLSLSGVKAVIVAMGINDVSQFGNIPGFQRPAEELCTLDELKAGLTEVVGKCREKGIPVIGATLTPFKGSVNYSETGAKLRADINEWILTGGLFDETLDLGKLFASPEDSETMPEGWQVGDYLHPNHVGGAAAAEQIDVACLLSVLN